MAGTMTIPPPTPNSPLQHAGGRPDSGEEQRIGRPALDTMPAMVGAAVSEGGIHGQ